MYGNRSFLSFSLAWLPVFLSLNRSISVLLSSGIALIGLSCLVQALAIRPRIRIPSFRKSCPAPPPPGLRSSVFIGLSFASFPSFVGKGIHSCNSRNRSFLYSGLGLYALFSIVKFESSRLSLAKRA